MNDIIDELGLYKGEGRYFSVHEQWRLAKEIERWEKQPMKLRAGTQNREARYLFKE